MPEIDIYDKKISYTRKGKGKPLIMGHGWPVTGKMFEQVAPLLAERNDVITFDFPGFGKSQELAEKHTYGSLALAMVGLMNALEIPKATISGVSMGAAVGLMLASEHPDRVERLILNSPPVHHSEEVTDKQKRLLEIVKKVPYLKYFFYFLMKGAPDLFCQQLWGEKIDKNDSKIKPIIESAKHSSIRGPWEMLLEFTETDLRPILSKVAVPTTVFVGTLDHQFLRPAKIIADGVQNGKIEYLEGADHWLAIKNPPLFAEQILDALRLPE